MNKQIFFTPFRVIVVMSFVFTSIHAAGVSTSRSNIRNKSKMTQDSGTSDSKVVEAGTVAPGGSRIWPKEGYRQAANAGRDSGPADDSTSQEMANTKEHNTLKEKITIRPERHEIARVANDGGNSDSTSKPDKTAGTSVQDTKGTGAGTERLLPTVNKKTDGAGGKRTADSLATPE